MIEGTIRFIPPKSRDWMLVASTLDLPRGKEIIVRRALNSDPAWMRIAGEVCRKHRVTINELKSPRREKRIVLARQEAIWRVKKETAMSLPAIGRKFNRDHTTVIWSVRRHQSRIEAGTA